MAPLFPLASEVHSTAQHHWSDPGSPSSSMTALSGSSTPPLRGSMSKIFSLPSFTFSAPTSPEQPDVEKLGATAAGSSRRQLTLRRRRILGQVIALGSVIMLSGWVLLGMPDAQEVMIGVGIANHPPTGSSPPSLFDDETSVPGVVIGFDGIFHGSPTSHDAPIDSVTSTHASPAPLSSWAAKLDSSKLLAGLSAWPPNPVIDEETPPLSELGHFADNIYKLGPLTMKDYAAQLLEFVELAFPKKVAAAMRGDVTRYLEQPSGGVRWDKEKYIWQTDKDERHAESVEVESWNKGQAGNEGWEWDLVTDPEADDWIGSQLDGSRVKQLWDNLPSGILRSDTLRYLLLLLNGGIYSDTDTSLLKAPSHWGSGATLWRNGAGWLADEDKARIDAGEDFNKVIGKASVVVGVEADVGGREDWFDWWPRPIQIVQWTMASAPHHPIALSAVLRILHATAVAIDWSHEHAKVINDLKTLGRYEDMEAVQGADVLSEPKDGGPLGIMAWTGPGVWTDAVLSYLRVKYGMLWTDLKDLRVPLRVGDVIILPVTGFSPGVGNFGSQPSWHGQAMVEHKFRGSWKANNGRTRR